MTVTDQTGAIMESFKSLISTLAFASLGFSIAAAYLKINKIWKRKHIEEVANSVSIAGNVVDLIPLTFFALNFLLVAQWQGLIDSIIWIAAGMVSVLIGSGMWVQKHHNKSFWTRVKEALKLERSEVGDLASALFRSSSAEIIMEMLAQFAYIDRELEANEKAFIQAFADKWNLEVEWEKLAELADVDRPLRLVKARETVDLYLKTTPPDEQAAQLIDVLQTLVRIDKTVTDQEKLILDEVNGLLLDYISYIDSPANYSVVIAPQSRAQESAIAALLPDKEKTEVAGGFVYTVGSYYSKEYAELICDQYRTMGYLTIDLMEAHQNRG
jgi:hypothetical protein